jgi:NADH:ubiquinone oxidoreductase subunit F (NADH-binding)
MTEGSGERLSQRARSTRLFSVSGPVNHPGIVEVESRVSLRELLFEVAAGLRDQRALYGVLVAGRSGVLRGPELLDSSLESLAALTAGSRGVIAIPDGDAVVEIVEALPVAR